MRKYDDAAASSTSTSFSVQRSNKSLQQLSVLLLMIPVTQALVSWQLITILKAQHDCALVLLKLALPLFMHDATMHVLAFWHGKSWLLLHGVAVNFRLRVCCHTSRLKLTSTHILCTIYSHHGLDLPLLYLRRKDAVFLPLEQTNTSSDQDIFRGKFKLGMV